MRLRSGLLHAPSSHGPAFPLVEPGSLCAHTHQPVPACVVCLGPQPLRRKRGGARVRLDNLPSPCLLVEQLLCRTPASPARNPCPPRSTRAARGDCSSLKAKLEKASGFRLPLVTGCAPVASCLGEGERLWSHQKEPREEDPSVPAPNQSGPQPALGSANRNFWVLQARFSHLSWI